MRDLRRTSATHASTSISATIPLLTTGKRSPVVSTVDQDFQSLPPPETNRLGDPSRGARPGPLSNDRSVDPGRHRRLLFAPMAFTTAFGPDWTLHLWPIRQQELNIRRCAIPACSCRSTRSASSTRSSLRRLRHLRSVAPRACLIGPFAVPAADIVGLAMAYGGLTWLAVQFGLRGWRSQMPAACSSPAPISSPIWSDAATWRVHRGRGAPAVVRGHLRDLDHVDAPHSQPGGPDTRNLRTHRKPQHHVALGGSVHHRARSRRDALVSSPCGARRFPGDDFAFWFSAQPSAPGSTLGSSSPISPTGSTHSVCSRPTAAFLVSGSRTSDFSSIPSEPRSARR